MDSTPQERGLAFEKRVERIFKRLGKSYVVRDVQLRDPHGNISQIDLRFGLFRKTYVECKCYSGSVPLKVSAERERCVAIQIQLKITCYCRMWRNLVQCWSSTGSHFHEDCSLPTPHM
jgi:hypothetical protein